MDDLSLPAIFETPSEAVLLLNLDLRILYINPSACQLFGHSCSEVLGKPLQEIVPLQLQKVYFRFLDRFLCSAKKSMALSGRNEIFGYRKNGEVFSAQGSLSKIPVGNDTAILVMLREISPGEKSEIERKQNENRYRSLVETQSDLIFRVDQFGRFTFANKAFCEKFGKDQDELLGKAFLPLVQPEDLAQNDEMMKLLYQPPYRISVEQRDMTPEGWRWISWEYSLIQEAARHISEIQAVGHDITEKKFYEQLLIAQRDLAQRLTEVTSIPQAMEACLDKIFLLTQTECGGGYLKEPVTSGLRLVYSTGLSEKFAAKASYYAPDSDRWKQVMQGEPILSDFSKLSLEISTLLAEEKLTKFLMVPLAHRGDVLGCVNLASHQNGVISPRDLSAAQTLALQMGSTISRLLTEQRLAANRSELETLFNSIEDFLVAFDSSGKIVKVNQQVLTRLGYAEDELIGEPVEKLHPKELHEKAGKILTDMIEGRIKTCPLDLLSKDGMHIPVETRVDSSSLQEKPVWIGISRDISEQAKMNQELHESKEQLSLALEASQLGLWDWQIQEGQLVIDERWADMLGYTLEDLQPVSIQTWIDICHPEDLEKSNRLLEMHFAGKTQAYECELRVRHKSGHWDWVLDRGRVIAWDENGKPLRMIGAHLDITHRRMMEEEIRYRLEFETILTDISARFINLDLEEVDEAITHSLQQIGELENMDRSYVFLVDPEQQTMSNTHEWCGEGIEPSIEMLQDLSVDIFPWWMKQLAQNQAILVSQVERMPDEASAEREILRAQDILSVAVVPLIFNNQLQGFAGFDAVRQEKEWKQDSIALLQQYGNILSNFMERRRFESELQRSEERNTAILNAIPDNVFRLAPDGSIRDVLISDHESLLLSAEEVIGQNIQSVFDPETAEAAMEKIRTALTSGQNQTFEYQIPIQGQMQFFEARLAANSDNEVIAISRNVSEQARFEQMKTDFIHRAIHDLRTPHTTVLLMTGLLEGECTPEEREQYWSVLKEELERERALIEDLLTVGRLENNQWEVKIQAVHPMQSLEQSLRTIQPQADEKGISIQLKDAINGTLVKADQAALQQIFTNLLNNAVKFTPFGGNIRVDVFQKGERIFFEVKDDGMGIPPEDMPHIFSRFFRATNATENEIQGSGIGLFMVKSMVKKFKGEIDIESRLGEETLVRFWLPLADTAVQDDLVVIGQDL